MGDPASFIAGAALNLAQFLLSLAQGRAQGKKMDELRKEMNSKLDEIMKTVLERLPANSTPQQVALSTAVALLNTPIQSIIIGKTTDVAMPPKDIPRTTGLTDYLLI